MSSVGDLYAPTGPVSHLVNAVIAYAGLNVNRPAYKHWEDNKSEAFLKDFPHGKVPAFKAKDGITIFEGYAIARYLAALAPESGLLPGSLGDLAHVDQWCHLIDSEIRNFAFFNYLWTNNYFGPFTQELSDILKQREERALATVDKHLEGRTYLVGDKITLADLELAATIRFTIGNTFAKAEREKYANVFNHYERLVKLPSLEPALGGATYAEESLKHKQPEA